MARKVDLSELLEHESYDAGDLFWEHVMDVSASIYDRMHELGVSNSELARRMGVSPSRVTRIIEGSRNLTLKTLARLESALSFRMDSGFRYRARPKDPASSEYADVLLFQATTSGRPSPSIPSFDEAKEG